MILKKIINENKELHWIKMILRPLMIFLIGRTGEDKWLELLSQYSSKKIDTIFDVGSSSGWFLEKAFVFFKDAEYYHFEPRRDAILNLKKIISKLKSNSKTFNLALSNKNKFKETFWVMEYADASSLVNNTNWKLIPIKNKIFVRLARLDSIVKELNINKIDYLKIDVEGAELNVLLGAQNTLKTRVSNVMLEIGAVRHQKGPKETLKIFNLMFKLGFYLIDTYENNYLFSKDLSLCKYYGLYLK